MALLGVQRGSLDMGIAHPLPGIDLRWVGTPSTAPSKRSERLTRRELEYVVLVCQEKEPTPGQLAVLMECAEKTVETHRYNVYRKWKVRTRTELVSIP